MTAPNQRVDTVAHILKQLAVDITRAIEHIHTELGATDWHPADTMAGGTGKGGVSDPTGNVATARSELTGRREDIRDWITGLEGYTRSGRFLVDQALKIRMPAGERSELFDTSAYTADPCKYRWPDPRDPSVTLTCTNWASEHLLPGTTIKVDLWCVDHWPLACQIHGDHLAEQRRVDGVPACQKAYRDHKRETEAVA